MTTNPYWGIRFLILEETDIGTTVINEYDTTPIDAPAMRITLQKHVDILRQDHPERTYHLKEETINDQTNEV